MTKRSADERPKYITVTLALFQNEEETRIELLNNRQSQPLQLTESVPELPDHPGPCGKTIHIDARTWYVWKRYGGVEHMLEFTTRRELCAHCDEQHVDASSYHGWFCYHCQRTLANLNLLPEGDPNDEHDDPEPFVPVFVEDDEDED